MESDQTLFVLNTRLYECRVSPTHPGGSGMGQTGHWSKLTETNFTRLNFVGTNGCRVACMLTKKFKNLR